MIKAYDIMIKNRKIMVLLTKTNLTFSKIILYAINNLYYYMHRNYVTEK